MDLFFDILYTILVAAAFFLIGSAFQDKVASKWKESPKPDFAHAHYLGVDVTIHPSAGSDGAPVVQIETSEDLEGTEGPLIRVLINDDDTYVGVPFGDAGLEDDLRLIRKYNDDEV